MGKVKWGTGAKAVDDAEERESDFTPYEGDVPTAGVYRLAARFLRVTAFDSGNSGLTMLWVVDEPKSSAKAIFNGAPIWERLVDTDTQTWKIKQFMRAIGGTGRHWANTVSAENERGDDEVQKFGNIVVAGLRAKALLKRGSYQGEPRAEVARWMPKADESDDSADDTADSGDDTEPPF